MKGRHMMQTPCIMRLTENNVVFFFISLLFLFPFSGAQSSPSEDGYILQNNHFKFSPVLGIVLFCLISAFFIMGFISVYYRHCFERGQRSNYTFNEANRYPRRTFTPGIDQVLIDTFPTFLYSDVKGHKIGKAALECAVCLNEFEDGETLRLLPKCCHVFHPHCIDTWLAYHVTCPVCRANLVPVPGEDQIESNNVYDSVAEPTQTTRLPEAEYQVRDITESSVVINIGSPEVANVSRTINNERLTLEKSKFSRSHSTGHSMIQLERNRERFTLRLPEELRKKLMQPEIRRGDGNVSFPSVMSSKKGFRSNSFGSGRERNYNHPYYDSWGFTLTSPFVSRTGSSSSVINEVGADKLTKSGKLLKSVKSPIDRLFGTRERERNDTGERSFTKLTQTPV